MKQIENGALDTKSLPVTAARRLPFPLRQRFGDFAGVFDEQPRDRAERAVLQRNEPDCHAGSWQFNGQDLDLLA